MLGADTRATEVGTHLPHFINCNPLYSFRVQLWPTKTVQRYITLPQTYSKYYRHSLTLRGAYYRVDTYKHSLTIAIQMVFICF